MADQKRVDPMGPPFFDYLFGPLYPWASVETDFERAVFSVLPCETGDLFAIL